MGALAHSAAEKQQRDHRRGRRAQAWRVRQLIQRLRAENVPVGERPDLRVEQRQSQQQEEIADSGHDEGLEPGLVVGRPPPETDQQVSAHTRQRPEDEKGQQIVKDRHAQHPASQEGEVGEEVVVAPVGLGRAAVHISLAVDENYQADKRDGEEHHSSEWIDVDAQGQTLFPGGQPADRRRFVGPLSAAHRQRRRPPEDDQRQQQGEAHPIDDQFAAQRLVSMGV